MTNSSRPAPAIPPEPTDEQIRNLKPEVVREVLRMAEDRVIDLEQQVAALREEARMSHNQTIERLQAEVDRLKSGKLTNDEWDAALNAIEPIPLKDGQAEEIVSGIMQQEQIKQLRQQVARLVEENESLKIDAAHNAEVADNLQKSLTECCDDNSKFLDAQAGKKEGQ